MVRPRATMRAILDREPRSPILPLVLAAVAAGFLGDLDVAGMREALGNGPLPLAGIVGMLFVAVAFLTVLAFYALSWVAFGVARFLEGNGTARQVRLALAWGLAPAVWSLVYRIPAALFMRRAANAAQLRFGNDQILLNPGIFAEGCGIAALMMGLELVLFAWWMVVSSHTVAEANGFSAWKGLATIAVALISPAIVAIAVILATVT